jgi:hypothetical protein
MNGHTTIIPPREAIAFSTNPKIVVLSKGILGQMLVKGLSRENASANHEVGTMELSSSILYAKASSPVLVLTPSVNKFFSICASNVSILEQLSRKTNDCRKVVEQGCGFREICGVQFDVVVKKEDILSVDLGQGQITLMARRAGVK